LKIIKSFKEKTILKGYLQLCRPANLPTATADIIAGMSLSGIYNGVNISYHYPVFLILSSILLYAGGVILNDIFDANLDKIERPERPIPSGVISLNNAKFFSAIMLLFGVLFSFFVNIYSGLIAFFLCVMIFSYNSFLKKEKILGPLNMGLCRGLNLLLGMSILNHFSSLEYILIPIIFVFAITVISLGEVHGNNKKNLLLAGFLYLIVIFLVFYFHSKNLKPIELYLPFLVFFALMIIFPLLDAYKKNTPEKIKNAVVSGVLGIIILDATIAIAYSNWTIGILIILLLPLSMLLSKLFAIS